MDKGSRRILKAHIEEQKELAAALYRNKEPGWVSILLRISQLEKGQNDRDSNTGQDNPGAS